MSNDTTIIWKNNTVKWAVETRLLPEDTQWYTTTWECRKLIGTDRLEPGTSNENVLHWRRSDLTLGDASKKTILLTDMACLNESKEAVKRDEKIGK